MPVNKLTKKPNKKPTSHKMRSNRRRGTVARKRTRSASRPSAVQKLIEHRETEIPRLCGILRSGVLANDEDCRQTLLLLTECCLNEQIELLRNIDVRFISTLLTLLARVLDGFESEWRKQPRLYRTWARNNDRWPCMVSARKLDREPTIKYIFETLELGTDHPLNLSGKYDLRAVGTKVAMQLFELIDNCASEQDDERRKELGYIRGCLPPLSRELIV